MPCSDINNCTDHITDACVLYTGEDSEEFGLCKGKSTLKDLESVVLARLSALATGKGTTLSELTVNCNLLKDLVDGDYKLDNLVQALFSAVCTLKSEVTTLTTQINASTAFDTACLSTLPANPTRDQILQALLTKVCAIDGRVTIIENDYVKASQLGDLINGHNSSVTIQQYKVMPKYVAMEYYGPLSVFDAAGKGLAAAGYEHIYYCNGQTVKGFTTPDKRGRVAVGAVAGVPGGSLDSAVDPMLPGNAGSAWALKQKFGQGNVTLSLSQIPSHGHVITDPGHDHALPGNWGGSAANGDGKSTVRPNYDDGTQKTTKTTTNITVAPSGGGQPHTNYQPSIAAHYIMYIP